MRSRTRRKGSVPRRSRRPGALSPDLRSALGENLAPAELAVATIELGNLDQTIESLTEEFVGVVYDQLGSKPIAEQVDRTWADFKRRKRGAGVATEALEKVPARAARELQLSEALPA